MTISLQELKNLIDATSGSVIASSGLSGSTTLGLVYYPNNSGVLTLADKDTDTRGRVHGIGTGNTGEYIVSGEVTGLTGLTAGEDYYLGDDGAITKTVPTDTDDYVLFIGQAISTTVLLVQMGEMVKLT